ncbi:chitobiase/beta-hexosaminidase C-terminal domain-containing protein [Aporhodopirellula aestuarii]|uniref:Chitobiase/beta-hexosaminidase C-terminal domain-containing protein n=1 Tax=Aporhodopirellula aestuarii TaxID=2950107 RepID=A0ABT0UBI2_9BACT|nr:chitobiase/beta-hexosaminidase C-terminal domain-containing protein [Aporhodopirellula aestuarii]MCM2373733.1 chitobiase/beta-hexosaminidase C-terminal domain-containing protein [Aporhodopirellula aestuarii]
MSRCFINPVLCLHLFVVASGCFCASPLFAADPAHETEAWSPGRLLTWATPGVSGKIDEASNWIENGRPADKAPDRETDVVLPAADEIYTVTGGRNHQVRHVTIKKNARLKGGHRNEVEIWGNVDVLPEGMIRYVSVVGGKHTYFRVEGSEFPNPQNGHAFQHPSRRLPEEQLSRAQLSHKFQVCKYGTASVEFYGNLGVSDEVMLQHGKMIISGDFRFSGVTNKGTLEVYDGGILEIQTGGRVGPFMPENNKNVYNISVYRNGVIQAGSPERPLTGDAYLLLGFGDNEKLGHTGLYTAVGSMMRVYSSDPTKARLVVQATASVADFRDGLGQLVGNPDVKANGKNGIAMQLGGDVELDGVHFDYVCDGGIATTDPETPKQWKHVTFGAHNAGPEDTLFSQVVADTNSYYHTRNDQQSEWGLTETAMASMRSYLEQSDPFRLRTVPENTEMKTVGKGNKSIQTPVAVVFDEPVLVSIETRVPGARIRYTTDGTEPTKESPAYTGPIRLSKTTKLMMKAYKTGVGYSPTTSTTYVFQ